MREMSPFPSSPAHYIFATDYSGCLTTSLQQSTHLVSHLAPMAPVSINASPKCEMAGEMGQDQQQDIDSTPRRDYLRSRKSRLTRSSSNKRSVGIVERQVEVQARQTRPRVKALHKRTKTGCLTCRKRRIKCDEEKPICERCIKSRRLCIFPGQPSNITEDVKEEDTDQNIVVCYTKHYQSPIYEAAVPPFDKVYSSGEHHSQQTREKDQEQVLGQEPPQVVSDCTKFTTEKRSSSCISFTHDRIARRFESPKGNSSYIDPVRLQRRSVPLDIYGAGSNTSLEPIMLSSCYDRLSEKEGFEDSGFPAGAMFNADYRIRDVHVDKLSSLDLTDNSSIADKTGQISYDEVSLQSCSCDEIRACQWAVGNKFSESFFISNEHFFQQEDPQSGVYDSSCSSYSRDSNRSVSVGYNSIGNPTFCFMDGDEHSVFGGAVDGGNDDYSIFQNSSLDSVYCSNQMLALNESDNVWPSSQLSVQYGATSKAFTS